MLTRGRPMARLLVLAGVLCASAATPAAGPAPQLPDTGALSRYDALRPPEVRLRKLHLVRPDLIPYPLAYEVYC